jgi:glycerol-3-phosphate cytidylyltransferase-like family protein
MKTIALSGGCDPFHCGHLDYIQDAAKYGRVVFILNSDAWLRRKKGYSFMCFDERKRIVEAIKGVDEVVSVDDSDGTVCEALRRIKPDMFGKGGDRTQQNTPEQETCQWLGIEMIWDLGGRKTQASSTLVKNACNQILEEALFPGKVVA